MDKNTKYILDLLPFDLSGYFEKFNITEIRLRQNFPAKVCVDGRYITLTDGCISGKKLKEILMSLCGYTVSVYRDQLEKGFITLPGGHRVGIGARFDGITDNLIPGSIYSMVIRFASDTEYNIDPRVQEFKKGLLIAGPPHSGKTTLLKTLCRKTSENIVICDERNEFLAGKFNCDIISGIPKTDAISQAVRCMNPDVIICDEIGNSEECRRLLSFMNTGVRFVCTVHADSFDGLRNKPNVRILLESGVFDKIAILGRDKESFFIREVRDV